MQNFYLVQKGHILIFQVYLGLPLKLHTQCFLWNNYFIGEIFAVSPHLIPNSQRSYFNENPVRVDFEHKIKDYFNNTLYYIYYDGSSTNADIKRIHSYNDKVKEFEKKKSESGFLSTAEFELEEHNLKLKAQEAERAKSNLEKRRESGRSILSKEIIDRRAKEIPKVISNDFSTQTTSDQTNSSGDNSSEDNGASPYKNNKKFLVDMMFPRANKNERKLLSETLDKIFAIIQKTTDKKTAENIITKIKEELKWVGVIFY